MATNLLKPRVVPTLPAIDPATAPAPGAPPAAPATEYKPIPPADGLLATAVGSPTDPLPPIDPKTYEDDDVVNQMNRITSQDSDYMKLARTSGLQTANKRGLLNSSIAAGASEAEALKAAAPLAQQNSQNMASRNLARVQGYFEGERQDKDIANKLVMQGIDIKADEAHDVRDLEARLQVQGIDIAARSEELGRQLASNRELADLNIAAESERLGRQLSASEEQQIRQIASTEGLAKLEAEMKESQFGRELASREDMTRLQEAGATSRANLDAATRVQLQEMDNLSQEQKASLAAYIESNKMYADSIDALYANENLPAPARDAAMQNLLALRNSSFNLPAAVFGREMNWPGATPAATGGATDGLLAGQLPPPVSAPAGSYWTGPSYEEILAMDNDGIKGNYLSNKAAYDAWAASVGQPLLPPERPSGKKGLLGMGGALNVMSPAVMASKALG
jgi:hypothetical protein